MNQLLKIRPDWSFIIDRVERNVRHKRAPLSKKNATVAKRSVIRLKILQSATKVDTIFYLSEKVIRSALRIRRWQMKIFQSLLQAVYFDKTLVAKAIFHLVLSWPINLTRSWKTKKAVQKSKSFNREVSAIRVHVEHDIGDLKPSNIISDIYRNRKGDFEDKVMLIAAGWHDFRMSIRAAGK